MHVLEWIENGVQQTYEAPLFSDIVEMINILKSKNKTNENPNIKEATGGGTPQKVVQI